MKNGGRSLGKIREELIEISRLDLNHLSKAEIISREEFESIKTKISNKADVEEIIRKMTVAFSWFSTGDIKKEVIIFLQLKLNRLVSESEKMEQKIDKPEVIQWNNLSMEEIKEMKKRKKRN